MKIGFTAGAFDLCHAGHMLSFREAKKNCDLLVVALHNDPSMERSNKNKPIMSIEERRIILEGIRYIDMIFEYETEEELMALLTGETVDWMNPDIRFLGDDWNDKPFTGHELNIPIHWIDRSHGYSSSELRKRIAAVHTKDSQK